jgi:hypothetical protein
MNETRYCDETNGCGKTHTDSEWYFLEDNEILEQSQKEYFICRKIYKSLPDEERGAWKPVHS